jgi:hypothetical protein
MLDRSIRIRKALVHSIPISEVIDMKSEVLRALKGSLSGKKALNLVCGLNFNISTIGIEKKLKFVSNSFFSFITYPFLLIDLFEV